MTKSEIAELVKLCSYPELQKLWKPKVGDEVYHKKYQDIHPLPYVMESKQHIWLPRTDDAIRLMGDRFFELHQVIGGGYSCQVNSLWFTNKFARIACLKALKAILVKEDSR